MTISPGSPSTMMGEAFGEAIRSFRDLDMRSLPSTAAETASIRLFVEEAVANGSSLFDAFLRFDVNWRTAVFRGEIPYDEATESLIADNIRKWVENGEAFLSVVDQLEAGGMVLPDVEPFRSRVAEGRGMLTPDDEFFEGEGLDELTARAIDEDDRGLTVEFKAMGE